MNRRLITLSVLAATLAVPVSAKPRSESQIMQSAAKVLLKAHPEMRRAPLAGTPLKTIQRSDALTVVGFENGAYAIISNDDRLPEVLGYSTTPFDVENSSPAFRWWLRSIKTVAARLSEGEGERVVSITPEEAGYTPEVPNLLSDAWGQMEPFNNDCPIEYDGGGRSLGRCVVGCVATSATQVMRYHQWPKQGEGIHVDMQTVDAFGKPIPLVVDFSKHRFKYHLMRDTFSPGTYSEEEGKAIAEFSHAVGVSFGMIYSTGASGTYSDSAVYALNKYLKYPDAKLYVRREHDEDFWMRHIYEELSESRPILYSGADEWGTVGGGGHAFVLDGYNKDGLVHVNWGWFGRNDGYYEVALLNPRIHSFVTQQDMIIGVAPPEVVNPSKSFLALEGPITAADLAEVVLKSKEEGLKIIDLSKATLPDDHLPDMAFYSSNLQKIILPAGLRSIGDGAFGKCRRLTEVVFPEKSSSQDFFVEDDIVYSRDGKEVVSVLPYYRNLLPVVTDYTSLLKFREGVTTMRPYAADGCFRIQGVEIPASMTRIGTKAFANASRLKAVIIDGAVPPRADAFAFSSLDPGFTKLFIPAGTSETFCRAGEWAHFFSLDNVYETGTNIKARNYVRGKGEPNPYFGYQVFGEYVTGEPELTCEADIDSPAGEYPIVVSMGSLSGENIVLTNGVLRVIDGYVGVESVEETTEAPYDVIAIDGRVILRGAESLSGLDPGIYVVNGRKTVISAGTDR